MAWIGRGRWGRASVLLAIVLSAPSPAASLSVADQVGELTISGPPRIDIGDPATFVGRMTLLEQGLVGQRIDILVDGETRASGQTTADGNYAVEVTFDEPGYRDVRAAWAPAGLPLRESRRFDVKVTDPFELDPGVATNMLHASRFLFTGPDASQKDVDPSVFDPRRIAVVRGRVADRQDDPLSGVRVSVLDHPEFGWTTTRSDGIFDLAVNGGGSLVIEYRMEGLLPAQRLVAVPWQRYAWAADLVMVPLDPAVTTVSLDSPSLQSHRASVVTDADGQRRATVMFPAGTSAEMVLADGSRQALTDVHVRATEYTIGAEGPAAMPADLPATSGYTYAVELSVDEAFDAGATSVEFDQPVAFYVENFLGFPVGGPVPAGYYDRSAGRWVPSENGLVVQVLGSSGGAALLDLDGDGQAESAAELAAIGIGPAERAEVARLYPAGRSLWRVPVRHFTPWDCNWPYGPPEDAEPPDARRTTPRTRRRTPDPCEQAGSIIECQNQVLGERISLTGSTSNLNYRSDRVPGRRDGYTVQVALTGESPPESLVEIRLEVSVAGRKDVFVYPAEPNKTVTYAWDGRDAYGRIMTGSQAVTVDVGYAYKGRYLRPSDFVRSFARASESGTEIGRDRSRGLVILWRRYVSVFAGWDARGQGIGGWTLDEHHAYDPMARTLHEGDGDSRALVDIGRVIDTIAGTGLEGSSGDGGPARDATFHTPGGVAVGPDGSVYVADEDDHRIRKIDPDGIITTIAGNGERVTSGDGGPAIEAGMDDPDSLAIGPDGSVYVALEHETRVRRIDPQGIITTVAGTGQKGFSGDGGPATEAQIGSPDGIAVGPDGSLYITEDVGHRVRRVDPDGIISTVVGTSRGFSGDGGPATEAQMNEPFDVELGPDGSLYISDRLNRRIRRVTPDGTITTVAGNGSRTYSGDGGPATQAGLLPLGLAVAEDGTIYVADDFSHTVRRIGPDGIISTLAGVAAPGFSGDGGPAAAARLREPEGVALAPDGGLYIADDANRRIRRVETALPGFTGGEILIPSEDGREMFVFDAAGRHQTTRSTLTAATLRTFNYDASGGLASMVDHDGNVTSVERPPDGEINAIVSPNGQRTAVTLDDGYASSFVAPGGGSWTMGYEDGLLRSFGYPAGGTSLFSYDDLGRLVADTDPDAGTTAITREDISAGERITLRRPSGRTHTYEVTGSGFGSVYRAIEPSGATTTVTFYPDGRRILEQPDGTTVTSVVEPDPRFGMLAPMGRTTTLSPGGRSVTTDRQRTIELADPRDPLSLRSMTETVVTNGRTWLREYDAATRTLTEVHPSGRRSAIALDAYARPTSLTTDDDQIQPVRYVYDARGRVSSTSHGAESESYGYDGAGRLVSIENAAGERRALSHDEDGSVVSMTLPSGDGFTFDRDANGAITQLTMASGATHQMTYTSRGRQLTYQAPGAGPWRYGYDDDALVSTTTPTGRRMDRGFDGGGRLTSISYPEADVELAYAGATERPTSLRRVPASGGASQDIAWTWNAELPTSMTFSGPASGAFSYSYTADGFLSVLALQAGPRSAEYLVEVDADGLATRFGAFSFDRSGPAGALAAARDDAGMAVEYGYDPVGRLASRTHSVGGSEVYRLDLTRDIAGRINTRTETTGGSSTVTAYAYDANGRLIGVSVNGDQTESYAYDANGNRTSATVGSGSETASYDAADRITAVGQTSYSLDEDGFLTARGDDRFTYSARGELLSATVGGQTTVNTYDGIGRLMARTDDAGTIQYLYGAPWNPLQLTHVRERNGDLSAYHYDDEGLLIGLERGGQRFLVVTDQVGTPLAIYAADGTLVKRLAYDTFGRLIDDSDPGFALAIGFAGGIVEPRSGLVRFGARDYDPVAGRWTAMDPALYGGGQFNLYAYAGNDPVNRRDPTGLAVCFGGSAYAGIGVGGKLCLGLDGFTACIEAGFGVGTGTSVEVTDLPGSSSKVAAEVSAGCGPFSMGASVELDNCGNLLTKGKAVIDTPVKAEGAIEKNWTTGDLVGTAKLEKGEPVNFKADCKVEGKVYAETCVSTKGS